MIFPAFDGGNLTIRTNATVREILVNNDTGKARGVAFIDTVTGKNYEAKARVVVLAASTLESARLLLLSKSRQHPNGIGNSNDVIGRYLVEQVRFHVYAFMPELLGGPVHNDDGISGEHLYLPRFNHRDGRTRDYARGFGMQFWGIGCQAGAGWAKGLPGFGADYKRQIKRHYPAWVELHPYGEVAPVAENRVEIDETRRDAYDVPLPRIVFQYGTNEMKMLNEMYDTVEQILQAAKAEIFELKRGTYDSPGSAIHEHGTCRMGTDPHTSALNGFCQMHAVKNLFVVDGSAFPSATEKNPTLTILALAWRATDYLISEMKKGDL